jgi:GDP-mannose 6-dehydrogenase
VRISIFGVGYVGAVSCGCLAALGHEVVGVDTSAEKVALLARGQSPIVEDEIGELIAGAVRDGRMTATVSAEEAVNRTEVSFISVGTPSAPDGSVALGAVDGVSRAIGRAIRGKPGAHTVVMRSTVPPGTAEDRVVPILEQESGRKLGDGLAYYSNPEFLREGTAVADFRAPPFTILGAPPGDDAPTLRELYAAVPAPVHVVPYRVAESVKVLCNAYHAVKLAFANEAGGVLATYGVDAREAFRLFCEDRQLNISPAYLRPGFAFGGSCLPKDMRSFLALARDKGVATPFLGGVMPSNEAVVERALALVTAGGRRPVALLGLAFKPGTDDLRESPFVVLAERLLGKGYPLRIFDRHVDVARLLGSNRTYIEREIPHLERLLVPGPAEAVTGAEVVVVGHLGREDRPALLQALGDDQSVLDLVGIPELHARAAGRYQGLCW